MDINTLRLLLDGLSSEYAITIKLQLSVIFNVDINAIVLNSDVFVQDVFREKRL